MKKIALQVARTPRARTKRSADPAFGDLLDLVRALLQLLVAFCVKVGLDKEKNTLKNAEVVLCQVSEDSRSHVCCSYDSYDPLRKSRQSVI